MTPFRNWIHNLWIDNCEERILYSNSDRLSEREYFLKFKWWLKREYRHQQQLQQKKEKYYERFGQ